jgi:hypothetical protein
LNACASQNLQRKRKRGLSEVKIAVFVRKWKKWLVVYCCDGRYSLGGERSQHKIFTAWFSTPYFALRTISVRYLCLNRCPHRSKRSLNPIHWQIRSLQTNRSSKYVSGVPLIYQASILVHSPPFFQPAIGILCLNPLRSFHGSPKSPRRWSMKSIDTSHFSVVREALLQRWGWGGNF